LGEVEYLTGGIYGMSDIATFPWLRSWEKQGMQLADYPNLERWFNAIAARPAVERGIAVLAEFMKLPKELSAEAREVLFGARQYERR
jgi:GST-like protein